MTKKTKIIVSVSFVLVAIVVAIVIIANRKFKKYELTEDGKRYMRIYTLDDADNIVGEAYATGAQTVMVAPSRQRQVLAYNYNNGADGNWTMIPIKKLWFDDGSVTKYNSKTDYIISDYVQL